MTRCGEAGGWNSFRSDGSTTVSWLVDDPRRSWSPRLAELSSPPTVARLPREEEEPDLGRA